MLVMTSMILIEGPANSVVARRIGIRDRLGARFRAFELDQALADGTPPDTSAVLALRARRLIAERTRRQLGETLRRVVDRRGRCPSVVHVSACPQTVVDVEDLLAQLARRLLAPAPVDARGVAQARILLSDGSGPLFWNDRAAELPGRLRGALEALEPGPAR
jgi:hypothetical protein